MIPGADKYATRKFIEKYSDWSEGHIFKKMVWRYMQFHCFRMIPRVDFGIGNCRVSIWKDDSVEILSRTCL